MMTSPFLDLPYEVLHNILVNINPQDLAGLCCCRTLDNFIKNDSLLYKNLYLQKFVCNTVRIGILSGAIDYQ